MFTPFSAAQDDKFCAVYLTGIGCPHCAKTDPVLLGQLPGQYPNLVIIEYEIYQQRSNAKLVSEYNEGYDSAMGVPNLVVDMGNSVSGDRPILNYLPSEIEQGKNNPCPLLTGPEYFDSIDLNTLQGSPNVWANDRILMRTDGINADSDTIKRLLFEDNVSSVLEDIIHSPMRATPIAISGEHIYFDNAVNLGGWVFQWNGEYPWADEIRSLPLETREYTQEGVDTKLTSTKIVSLALVDSVNPCALAVLTLMLIAIITYNPKNKRNVLLAGFAFASSVFVMYLFYGLVIIHFFKVIQALTSMRIMLYKILGGAAIALGILQIKDFFRYKPGGLATEMPLKWRPKVKKVLSGITSPKGAFTVGAFVTIFLLPCTIGPYVIAGGILSTLDIVKTLPWLLVYNAIFVFPMVAITLAVYCGIAQVENVSEWKDKNIKYLHLIAGTIILLLGIAMVLGWV